jgi:hypothetical protein
MRLGDDGRARPVIEDARRGRLRRAALQVTELGRPGRALFSFVDRDAAATAAPATLAASLPLTLTLPLRRARGWLLIRSLRNHRGAGRDTC